MSKPKENYGLIGKSKHLQRVRKQIETAAIMDRNVFIQGPTGTGKELIAKAVHKNSARKDKPFIALNCSQGTHDLLDSMLFGHEKGSFTGAIKKTAGYIERANGGTLFLDEVADAPLATQAKLLRAIQEHEFERIGGEETIKVDVRFIAATNKNIEEEIEEKRFRADLFPRLNQYRVRTKSLKSRSSDTIFIIDDLLKKRLKDAATKKEKMKKSDLIKLKFLIYHHDLPGNVRDLQNFAHSDLLHIVREFKTRLNRMNIEISHSDSDLYPTKKLTARRSKMRTALRVFKGDLRPKEVELIRDRIKPASVNVKEDRLHEICIHWCVKVFEIVRLTQKTEMSQKEIADLTKTRLNDMTLNGFLKRFGIPHPKSSKGMRYVMNCPVDALRILSKV